MLQATITNDKLTKHQWFEPHAYMAAKKWEKSKYWHAANKTQRTDYEKLDEQALDKDYNTKYYIIPDDKFASLPKQNQTKTNLPPHPRNNL